MSTIYGDGFVTDSMAEPIDTLDRATRDALLHRMVEGLHALIYGTYTVGSGDYALKALGDGGSVHEYVHGMLWLLPPRCHEQVESGGLKPDAAVGVARLDGQTFCAAGADASGA